MKSFKGQAGKLTGIFSAAVLAAMASGVSASAAESPQASVMPGAASHAAAPLDGVHPIGKPYHLNVSHAAQLAILGGATATVNGVVCLVTDGVGCAITPVISGIATPFIADATVCPNNGTRQVFMQDYHIPPPATTDTQPKILGTKCVPA